MIMRTTLSLSLVALLPLSAPACNKGGGTGSESTTTAAPVGETPPATNNAALGEGEVAQYPNMTPASGTRVLNQGFSVFQSADRTSKQLGSLSAGTWVDLKGSLGNWILINWPCGVGKLCPGWVEATVNDRRMQPEAGLGTDTTPTAIPTPSAVPTPSATAAPAASGGGRIKIIR